MASKSMNNAIDILARQQAAERDALKTAGTAGAAVQRAQERRAVELERLDQSVTNAERVADLALAALASLVGADRAAQLTGETPVRVRLGQQRASADDVSARVGELTGGAAPVVRRRGRPRGGGWPASGADSGGVTGLVGGEGASGALTVAVSPAVSAGAPPSEGR